MPQRRLGETLRSRREQLGYSLEKASYATNIRARVLSIFEEGDYANYPPRGHVQGMLSSYAAFLGLEPRLMLDKYEAEMAEYKKRAEMESTATRARAGLGRFGERKEASNMPKSRASRAGDTGSLQPDNRLAQEQIARNDDRYKSGSVRVVSSRPARGAARRFSDRGSGVRGARQYYPQTQTHIPVMRPEEEREEAVPSQGRLSYSRSNSRYTARNRSTPRSAGTAHVTETEGDAALRSYNETVEAGKSKRRARRSATQEGQQTGGDSPVSNILGTITGTIGSVFKETRTRLIAIAAVLIIIVVAIAAHMLISTAGNDDSGVIEVSGGAEDTTVTDTSSKGATATIKTTNGSPVSVHIEVKDKETSLINVSFDDDESYKGIAVGPWSRDFQVSESMTATFGNPDAVTVTENGTEVQIEKNEDGSGVLTLKIKSKSTAKD